ncbi:MAG: transposase [Gammaproteobacteria bacterium]|nr:transposase [Gammaproteobacteria bacterium]
MRYGIGARLWRVCAAGHVHRRQGAQHSTHAGQEYKEALRVVMAQPRAKRIFAQRKAMVEPVFSVLRERQGSTASDARGLAGVRLELRLHLIAYNISRAVAYAQRRAGRGILA